MNLVALKHCNGVGIIKQYHQTDHCHFICAVLNNGCESEIAVQVTS